MCSNVMVGKEIHLGCHLKSFPADISDVIMFDLDGYLSRYYIFLEGKRFGRRRHVGTAREGIFSINYEM